MNRNLRIALIVVTILVVSFGLLFGGFVLGRVSARVSSGSFGPMSQGFYGGFPSHMGPGMMGGSIPSWMGQMMGGYGFGDGTGTCPFLDEGQPGNNYRMGPGMMGPGYYNR